MTANQDNKFILRRRNTGYEMTTHTPLGSMRVISPRLYPIAAIEIEFVKKSAIVMRFANIAQHRY